jgi:hypothetical protein
MPERRRITAALLGEDAAPELQRPAERVARGLVVEVRGPLVVIAGADGEERFILSRDTTCWRGGPISPDDLRPGQDVMVLRSAESRWKATRLWAGIARACGVITARRHRILEIDNGPCRERQTVVIPDHAAARIEASLPRLEPGHLFDAVGLWRGGTVEALIPATRIHSRRPPRTARPPTRGEEIEGSVGWYDPAAGRSSLVDPLSVSAGAAYSALDPVGACGPTCERGSAGTRLPLVSPGMALRIHNLCRPGEYAAVAVTACGVTAAGFSDTCTSCSEGETRPRIAELTLAGFVALGGIPEAGGFTARITVPGGGAA